MKPGTIWRKTLIFSWIQLGLGLLTFFVCLMIAGVAWLIIRHIDASIFTNIAIGCASFLIAVAIYFLMMSRIGYNIKMGHLAIVERAHRGESIPANPVEFSKDVVKQRFGGNRQFYSIQRDVTTARNQILRIIAKGFSLETDVPDMYGGGWLRFLFCTPALTCIDECCLTYALRCTDYEINAACIDALTILVQDWKSFIKRATILSLVIYLICLGLLAIFFLPGFYLLQSLAIQPLFWLAISFFLVITVKIAFIDSYTLTKIVCQFLDIAQNAQIAPANYRKLDSWSKMYKKLRQNAEKAAEQADDEAFKAERAEAKAKRAKAALPAETETSDESTDDVKDTVESATDSQDNSEQNDNTNTEANDEKSE